MTQTATPRAGIYARQSLGKRKSIGEQDQLCTADAEDLGWQIADHYEDRVSASRFGTADRPGWDRLVADLDAGKLDVVVVWEASRGDRKLTTWSAFLDRCAGASTLVRVTDAEKTLDPNQPADWEWLAREGVNAVTESNKLSKRCRRGQMGQAKGGRPHGRVPYGFIRRYDAKTRELIGQEPHPEQAPVIAEIIGEVAAGTPLSHIAASLNERGIPNPSGKPWRRERIADYVSPIYVGKRTHRPKGSTRTSVFDTEWWPRLVDDETYYAARRMLDARRRAGGRGGRLEFWLSGVPTCGVCGSPVRGRAAGTHSTWARDRYGCPTGCVSVPAEELEQRVLAYVLARLARRDVYRKLRRAGAHSDAEAQAARDEAARLTNDLDDWRRSATDGRGTTPASLAAVEADLARQIADATRRADLAGVSPAVRVLLEPGADMAQRWADMSTAARRDVARDLVTVTVQRGGGRGVRVPLADRVAIAWKGTA